MDAMRKMRAYMTFFFFFNYAEIILLNGELNFEFYFTFLRIQGLRYVAEALFVVI